MLQIIIITSWCNSTNNQFTVFGNFNMISSIIDDVSLKLSCTPGSDLMSLVPPWNIYVSEDESITNSSFICFQVYITVSAQRAHQGSGMFSSIMAASVFL